MTGHLGVRVSALLDGQLSHEDTERAWAHVHACHACRDLVEREGWVKTRLACLSFEPGEASDHLKGSLLGMPPGDLILALSQVGGHPDGHGGGLGVGPDRHGASRTRRAVGFSAIGGGAVGCAVLGVLALGASPAAAPVIDRQAPVTRIQGPAAPSSSPTPAPSAGPTATFAASPRR